MKSLIKFGKEILNLCKKAEIKPIIYGSLAMFYYVKDKSIKVNDVDFLIKEKDFIKLVKVLDKNKIKYKYPKKWHTLIITQGKLKIEFDSIDFWQKGLKPRTKEVVISGLNIRIVSLKDLIKIYKRASRRTNGGPKIVSKMQKKIKVLEII